MGWSFDDKKTQGYIDKAMAANSSYKPIASQLEMAWAWLYQKREKEDPDGDDRELAAAEHYMYARWQVASGKTSTVVMGALTLGYDPAKLIGYIPLVFVIRKAAGHSWSRPSTDSLRWGMSGCADGSRDKP
ncbi:MAG: hypothetical protein U0167_02700 [bacterium]